MPSALSYIRYLRDEGYQVNHAKNGKEALVELSKSIPDVIMLDIKLPDMDGLEVLERISEQGYAKRVIIMTAHSSVNLAIKAMRSGAYDFLSKPFGRERVITTINNLLKLSQQSATLETLRKQTQSAQPIGEFIGSSAVMKTLYQSLRNIAKSDVTVMITGESGTGKEVCAQALHKLSVRSDNNFVALNCAAIPKDLLESEIFGHVKGAFTGAIEAKKGAATRADGGVLFLDEICELEYGLQAKLLRFVQTSEVQPVGGSETQRVDIRIVAATNRDPQLEVQEGRFREDLYYRLNVIPVHMPPLREREDDVIEIALALLGRFSKNEKKNFEEISDEARDLMRRYVWPGNIRELYHCLQRVVVMNSGRTLEADMLRPILANQPAPTLHRIEGSDTEAALRLPLKPLRDIELDYIREALRVSNQVVPQAAALLEISPSTIYRRLKELKNNG